MSDRVAVLENDLKQTKKTYGAVFTKLIKKVKTLEKTIKSSKARRRAQFVVSDDEEEEEDSFNQGRKIAKIDKDPDISLFTTPKEVYTAEPDISTANVPVSTAGAKVSTAAESSVYIRRSAAKRKDNEQFDEEERQRIASVHEKASTFNPEEWDNIQAQIKADEELSHRDNLPNKELNKGGTDLSHRINKVLFEATVKRVNTFTLMESDDTVPKVVAGSSRRSAEEELGEESSKRQKRVEGSKPAQESKDKESDELSQKQLQRLIIIVPEEGMNDLVIERFSSKEPTDDKERALWVELKRLFEPNTDDLLELQRYMHDLLTWRLYDTCGVHHVSTETGLDIFMLVEKDYPLTRGLPMFMLVNKLQVDQHSEMADELLRKIFILANKPRHYSV
ncbi:hypothetical protein Tco_1206272 [Tanacetum coccineum]